MSAPRARMASTLRPYLDEIDDTPLLGAEQERRLAERVADGDREARDLLARANLRLVVHLARSFAGRGVAMEDLVAEGNLGLIRAVETYDGRAGVRLSTYASHWIRQSIRAALTKQARPIRLPSHMVTLLAKWRRAEAVLADRLGREPTREEIGRALGLKRKKLEMALQAIRTLAAMPSPSEDRADAEAYDPGDALVDDRARPADERAAAAEERRRVAELIGRLDGREREVVRLRFGVGAGAPMTLAEVAEALGGCSRERVRQLEAAALKKLRAAAGPLR